MKNSTRLRVLNQKTSTYSDHIPPSNAFYFPHGCLFHLQRYFWRAVQLKTYLYLDEISFTVLFHNYALYLNEPHVVLTSLLKQHGNDLAMAINSASRIGCPNWTTPLSEGLWNEHNDYMDQNATISCRYLPCTYINILGEHLSLPTGFTTALCSPHIPHVFDSSYIN